MLHHHLLQTLLFRRISHSWQRVEGYSSIACLASLTFICLVEMPRVELSPLQIATRLVRMKARTEQAAGATGELGQSTGLDIVPVYDVDNELLSASSDAGSLRRSPFNPDVGRTKSFGAQSTPQETGPNPNNVGRKQGRARREKLHSRSHEAPEKELTVFAMRLAVLEKIASGVGTLGFIWATVVILGGYAITMKEVDFWFVTVILVIEGARIFSRSHELEWQHQTISNTPFSARAKSFTSNAYKVGSDAIHKSARMLRTAFSTFMVSAAEDKLAKSVQLESPDCLEAENHEATERSFLKRTWSSAKVPIFPYMNWAFQAKNVSRLLYWMQLASAIASIVLSVMRLSQQQFTRPGESDTEKNHTSALNVFYSLAVFEAMVFLIERSYWEWKIQKKKILLKVTKMCGLQEDSLYTTRLFFYDVYSKCLSESIFEGLKMDLVGYSLGLLQSDVNEEQQAGLRLLVVFASNEDYADSTLRRVGTSQGAVERLIEMITWKNAHEYKIRKLAAQLLGKLVKNNKNCVRVLAISGSIDSIFTLLDINIEDGENWSQDYRRFGGCEALPRYQVDMHILGLQILNNLAKDHSNCVKIGNKKRLLSRLVSYTDIDIVLLKNKGELDNKIRIVKKALQLLHRLTRTPGHSGTILRQDISKVVFTVTNLRNIIEHGQQHFVLQQNALDILCSLALDSEVRAAVGRTGGLIRSLFLLFLKEGISGDGNTAYLVKTAGETLTLLGLQSEKNCLRMLHLKLEVGEVENDIIKSLIDMMEHWELGHLAIRILRSFCVYTVVLDRMRIVPCTPRVLKFVMQQRGKLQEAAMGLAACTIDLMDHNEFDSLFTEEFTKVDLIKQLKKLLEHHTSPSTKLPRVRRYAIELVISLAEKDSSLVQEFQSQDFDVLLATVLDTQSDVENFATFSGAVGVTRHRRSMEELVVKAIIKLQLEERIFQHWNS